MAIVKGELVTCDRCGIDYFCKELEDTHTDGGLTTLKNYEPLPNGWKNHCFDKLGLLCADCEKEYKEVIRQFKAGYYRIDEPEGIDEG